MYEAVTYADLNVEHDVFFDGLVAEELQVTLHKLFGYKGKHKFGRSLKINTSIYSTLKYLPSKFHVNQLKSKGVMPR